MKHCFTTHFVFFLPVSLLPGASFATALISPEEVVNDFYHSYLSSVGMEKNKLTKKFVMPNVIQSINDSFQCNYDSNESFSNEYLERICSQKKEYKSSDGDYICNWNGVWVGTDVDYFTKSQDVYPSWTKKITIKPLEVHDKNADFNISLGEYPDPVTNLKVTLIFIDHSWKINSVTRD